MSDPEPHFGTAAPLRHELADALAMLAITAHQGAQNAEIGDDAALVYYVRKCEAYTRSIISNTKALAALKSGEPGQ